MGREQVEVLDGDVLRKTLCRGLGFSREDREENIRRITFVCHLLTRNNIVAIAAAVSPYRDGRDEARRAIGSFVEVFVKCPLEVLKQRDPKGLYRQALAGELNGLTGVSAPYEEPLAPEVVVETDKLDPKDCIQKILQCIMRKGYLRDDR